MTAPKKRDGETTAVVAKPVDVRIMEVAILLKCRYQKARDLMLSGVMGDARRDATGKLVVYKHEVDAYQAARRA